MYRNGKHARDGTRHAHISRTQGTYIVVYAFPDCNHMRPMHYDTSARVGFEGLQLQDTDVFKQIRMLYD